MSAGSKGGRQYRGSSPSGRSRAIVPLSGLKIKACVEFGKNDDELLDSIT